MQQSSSAATGAMSQTQQRLKADLKEVQDQIRALEQTAKTSGASQAQALEASRAEAAKLTDMIGRLGSAMQAEASAAAAATQATDRHKQAQESDEQATRRRAAAHQDLINGMRAAGDALTIGVSVPLAAATGAAIKFATEFETNTTRLVTLSGVSEENMRGMSKAMLDMAPAVGVGPGELSRAMLAVTSTGIRGKEALDILNISAKATAVGLGDTETVARTVVSAVNAWGSSNLTAAHAADVLYRTVVAGNAEASTLAPVLGRVTGIAAQMGISFEEVGASIATFTRLGVGADVAVTGLRDVLVHLLSPSKEAQKTFAEFGLSAAGVRKELAENGLMATLQHLMQITGGNVDVISEMLGDVRGLALVLGTAGAQADTYAQVLDEIKNGTMGVDDAHKRMQQTAGFIWNQLKAQLEVIFVQFGQELLPTLKELAPAIKSFLEHVLDVVKAFADLPQPVQTFIEAMIGLGIVGGPVLSGLARILSMWKEIRLAIIAAQEMPLAGWLARFLGVGTLGAGAVQGGAALVAGGIAYGAIGDGPGNLNVANGQNPNAQFTPYGALPSFPGAPGRPFLLGGYSPRTSQAEIDQLFNVPGALTPMGNSGVGMVAGTNAADIVGGLTAVTTAHEKASAEAKRHAKHLEEYANAAKDYTTVVNALGDELYEGIAYDLARGVSTAALADTYKVSETVIKDVAAAEKAWLADQKAQEAILKAHLDNIAASHKIGEEGAAAVVKGLGGQTVLRDLAFATGTMGPISARSIRGPLVNGVEQPMGLMPDLSGQARRHMFDVTSGASVGDAVRATMHDLPQIVQQAFTGGGGLGGAAQAVGVNLGASLFAKGGAANDLMSKGIGALFDKDGFLGKMLGDAIPVIGSMIGPVMTALIGHFHKPEWKKAMKDVGRDYGVNISDGLAQEIEKTEKKEHVGRNEATLLNLSKIIGEDGGLNDGNLAKYEGKLRDVFVGLETHTLTAAQATKVLDENFAAFATAATDKTGLLDDRMREMIALNQRFGTDSKEIAKYLKDQAKDVSEGFNKIAAGFATPIQKAWEKLQQLKTDGKSGPEHDAQVRKAEAEVQHAFDPARFGSQGALASLAFDNARASGMGLVDAAKAIEPGLAALRDIQGKLNQPIDATAQHLLALSGIIQAHPEVFAATDGLKQMATGLANSNQMTPEAYATIAQEAMRNIADMESLGLSHGDALDASKETLQVLYELQRRDPSLKLTPEMDKLLAEAKDQGLVGDKQLSAAERTVAGIGDVNKHLAELVRHFTGHETPGTTPGTPPTGPGTGPTVPGPDGVPVPPMDTPTVPSHGDEDGYGRGGAIPMAAGGDFLVSKPTLFLAGEAGIERATFSGAGRMTHPGGAPSVQQYTSYAITVNVRDDVDAKRFADLLRQDGVQVFVEEIEDGRHAKRLSRALQAVA